MCCLSSGGAPARLAAILRLLRPIADEIVVALDGRAEASAPILAGIADRILVFPHEEPADRPIAWLVGSCGSDWIFNIDDDEVPSLELLRELPRLVRRSDITHAWVARRWLHPALDTYLDEAPWNVEFQLRLFRADPRFVRFNDVFHRPVSGLGPTRFVDAPIWHLDTAVTSREEREAKALRYERSRPGMRIGAYSHNTGLYVPELRGRVRLADVPTADREQIEIVCSARARRGERASIEMADSTAIARAWPGAPYSASLYDARMSLLTRSPDLVSGVQQTVDVLFANRGSEVWRFGEDAITIGTRWDGRESIRTALPSDVGAGESVVIPVHVLSPEAGRHRLEIDLVHEHVRWFGCPLRLDVDVWPRRQVVVAGEPAEVAPVLDAIALVPELEPTVVDEGRHPRTQFGPRTVDGLWGALYGTSGRDAWPALARAANVIGRAGLRRDRLPLLDAIRRSECLILAGGGCERGAPETRDRLRVLVTAVAARVAGVPVVRVGQATPVGGIPDRLIDRATRALATEKSMAGLLAALRHHTRTGEYDVRFGKPTIRSEPRSRRR